MANGLKLLPKKRDAFTAIRRFMCDGDISLKEEEDKILTRWIYCNALLTAKELTHDEMVEDIAKKFQVSTFTARNDINNTQNLFSHARKISKKYMLGLHIDRMEQDIERIRKRLFRKETLEDGKEVDAYIDPKELAAYNKLCEVLTYTYNSMPEEALADKQPPPIFQFILAPGQQIEAPMLLTDALQKADELIMQQNPDGVYEVASNEKQ